MPVLYDGDDDFRRHDTEDYSFVTRSDRSRDFARRRRFGDDEEDRAMSQMSLPLRVSRLGSASRRSYSSGLLEQDYSPPRRSATLRFPSPYSERGSKLSGPVRQALALCGELDEDDPYYRARLDMTSPQYDDNDDDDEYVIVMRRRRKRQPPRRDVRDDGLYSWRETSASRHPQAHDDDNAMLFAQRGRQQSRKRELDEDASFGYTMPVSRRRQDEILGEDGPVLRDVSSYIATRRQFAVEDDDDIQKLKTQKYQYRTRGADRRFSDADAEQIDRKGDFAQAPMFIMKPRSHVVWEKMYVKFTCTMRGTPEPKVTWYHNMVAIEPATLRPGTMRISNQFGVHTLEIFQASLEDSGTYRISAQNHKGEISSYATLVVRRYDGVKTGYYDAKSGYNLKRPTDFPDVQKLDIPEVTSQPVETPLDEQESLLSFADDSTIRFSRKSTEVGDGKFETVLEFRIPGTNQPLEDQRLSLEATRETTIEPVNLARKREAEDASDNIFEQSPISEAQDISEQIGSKEEKREELSNCLLDSIDANPSALPDDKKSGESFVTEDVFEEKVVKLPVQEEENLLKEVSDAEESKSATQS